ncbi:MAG: amidohydrolase [Halioglobus sp.]
MQDLTVCLVQCTLAWEQPEQNRQHIERLLDSSEDCTADHVDLIVLPEMFNTGFSMSAQAIAETAQGPTLQWLQAQAKKFDCAIAGSIAFREDDQITNRLLFVTPDSTQYYDKRHLFRMAGETEVYHPGTQQKVVTWRDWRINLQVCYDLRFPVYSRNRDHYDLMLYVANWPQKRVQHWRALLIARAIENQACVVGVNRVGRDENNHQYSGDSLAIIADGSLALDLEDSERAAVTTLKAEELETYRQRFPFTRDADDFSLI